LKMYEESIHVTDTFRFDLLKVNSYEKIFILYFKTQRYEQGVQYLFAHKDLLDIVHELGFDFYVDQLLDVNYTHSVRYDGALYYCRESEPDTMANCRPDIQIDFYMDFGEY